MDKQMSDPSNAADEDSHMDMETGESSHESETRNLSSQLELATFASEEEDDDDDDDNEVIYKRKGILERWAKTFVMVPFHIAITLFITIWACSGSNSNSNNGTTNSFELQHLFVPVVVLNFYASVAGIILWRYFPIVARGFYVMAFFCTLLSLTILFGALLPDAIRSLPWILLAFVVFMVLGLFAYQNY